MHFDALTLNPKDKTRLLDLSRSDVHAIIMIAEKGYGKDTIARSWSLLKVADKNECILTLSPEGQSITIEQIRSLKSFFTLKMLNSTELRVAILSDADKMTIEAQNSILKLLEEPPINCTILMTVSHPEELLPTILSRATSVHLKPIEHEQVMTKLLSKGYALQDVKTAMSMSGNLIGLAIDILDGKQTGYVAQIQLAKSVLTEDAMSRLLRVDTIAKDRVVAIEFIDAMKLLCKTALSTSKNKDRWAKILRACLSTQEYLRSNVNTKLAMTNFLLGL